MKMKIGICLLGIMWITGFALKAQTVATQSVSMIGLHAPGNTFADGEYDFLGGKKKKKKRDKANFLAAGVVIGTPVGFGGRVIVRPSRLAVAGDIAYNRIRTDNGTMVNALVLKTDARLYAKGFIAKLLRPYVFGGMYLQRGNFNEATPESVFAADTGLGAGIKLWHLEINAEAGLTIPIRQVDSYRPGFGAFANVGIMYWLF